MNPSVCGSAVHTTWHDFRAALVLNVDGQTVLHTSFQAALKNAVGNTSSDVRLRHVTNVMLLLHMQHCRFLQRHNGLIVGNQDFSYRIP